MNKVILTGRVVKDIELKNNGGKDYIFFSIAVQRTTKDNEGHYESDFINCKAFGNTAKFISQYFNKGDGIELEGRITTSSYEKNGNKQYSTDILVNNVEFPKGKKQEQDVTNELPF